MNTIICAVFATLCIHSVYCQELTNISEKKSERIIGSKEKLVCLVTSPTDLNISWVKVDNENINKPIVLAYGNKVVIDDSRFSLQKDIVTELWDTSRHTLTITHLIKSDTGSYRCQAMLQSNNIIFTKIDLGVHDPIPPTIFNNMTSFVVVMEGRPLKLECYASGFPQPSIYWKRENNEQLFTGFESYKGNVLENPATNKEDRGNYYCSALNGVDPIPKRKIGVVVEFPPIVTTSLQIHRQALNYHVDLDCRIQACPTSTVVWMFRGMQLTNNQYFTISNITTSSKVIVDSNLHINITDRYLYGDYVCKTFNIYGAAEVTIKLYEITRKN